MGMLMRRLAAHALAKALEKVTGGNRGPNGEKTGGVIAHDIAFAISVQEKTHEDTGEHAWFVVLCTPDGKEINFREDEPNTEPLYYQRGPFKTKAEALAQVDAASEQSARLLAIRKLMRDMGGKSRFGTMDDTETHSHTMH